MSAVASISELAHCVVVSLAQRQTAADAIKAVQALAMFGPPEDQWPPLTPGLASFPNYWMALANALLAVDERTIADLAQAGVKFGDMPSACGTPGRPSRSSTCMRWSLVSLTGSAIAL